MPATSETLNEVGKSSTPTDEVPDPDSLNAKSDIDTQSSEKTQTTEKDRGGVKGDGDEDKGPIPYTRFKEVNDQKNEEKEKRIRAEERLSILEETVRELKESGKGEKLAEKELPFENVLEMSEEVIAEKMAKDPKSFVANMYAQIKHEVATELANEIKTTKSQDATRTDYVQYEKDNPSFTEMWKSGEIREYMRKHPAHNPISAHMMLTKDKIIKEKVDEAVAAKEKDLLKNQEAKRKANTLGGGGSPGFIPSESDKDLQNTKEAGGIVKVLADKLRAMRSKT